MADKTHLIVSGVARSGTTALAELLNSHEQVGIGIERFKFQFLLHSNYSAGLFRRDRFFDFRDEDTNLIPAKRPHWQGVYDAIAAKWDQARVIGDKVPDMTPVLPAFLAANPDFRLIFILRNLKDVGLSWQARADKPRDAWPVAKGFAAACESWAAQYRQMQELLGDADLRQRTLLLDYDRMFEADSPAEAAILSFLGLPPSAGFHQTFRRHMVFTQKRARRSRENKVPDAHVTAYKTVAMEPAKALKRISAQMVQDWAGQLNL